MSDVPNQLLTSCLFLATHTFKIALVVVSFLMLKTLSMATDWPFVFISKVNRASLTATLRDLRRGFHLSVIPSAGMVGLLLTVWLPLEAWGMSLFLEPPPCRMCTGQSPVSTDSMAALSDQGKRWFTREVPNVSWGVADFGGQRPEHWLSFFVFSLM